MGLSNFPLHPPRIRLMDALAGRLVTISTPTSYPTNLVSQRELDAAVRLYLEGSNKGKPVKGLTHSERTTMAIANATGLVPFFERLLQKVVTASNEAHLFGNNIRYEALHPAVMRKVVLGGDQDPFVASIIYTMALFSFADRDFTQFQPILAVMFPDTINQLSDRLCQEDIEEKLMGQQVPSNGTRRTTMVFNVGGDHTTIQMALDRGDRVVAIDRSKVALASLREKLSNVPEADLVLLQGAQEDLSLMEPWIGRVDVIYDLYTNTSSGMFTAWNVLARGGLLVYVNRSNELLRFLNHGHPNEFKVVLKRDRCRPPYPTPWARFNPRGFVFVLQRRADSEAAGKVLRWPTEQLASAFKSLGSGFTLPVIINEYYQGKRGEG